jgi:DNA-binding transcriptional LysR family regulator
LDRLDELAVFVAIIDSGSMAAAARKLRRSAPQVTRALSELENRAGARLVERTTRRLSPTEAGHAMAQKARALLADYDHMLSGVSEAPLRGLLRVTAPVQFGRRHVAPVVSSFLDAFREMRVELILHDRNLDLLEEGLDVAVRIGPLSDSTLLVRRVGEVRRLVVASPAYLESRGVPQRPADLARHDTIFNSLRPGPSEWRFGGRLGVRIAPRLLVNDVESQLLATRAGRGVARVLSYQVADDIAAGTLVSLLEGFAPPPLPVQLVARSGPHMQPKVRAFLDHAAAELRGLPVIRPAAG